MPRYRMKKKSFKIIALVLMALALLLAGLIMVGWYISSALCSDELVGKYKSPDNRHEIVYSIENCGATSPYVGNIFLDGKKIVSVKDTDNVKLNWMGSETVHIEYAGTKVYSFVKDYEGVKIDLLLK